ncbi:type II secretion system protein [Acidicapsa dinghuensis]|uniref:Type II secretion system protein n=1 Tax=Acidicapsa dinghuensis TaxID=2218256 RepID=A0ABW1EC35_9BACT|nr:type II secretion system protein [Acidicapsa dinghuensis]
MEQPRHKSRPFPRKERGKQIFSREGGYTLIAVLFLVVMVLITLSAAAPKMAADIQRDREVELIHRGKQYIRAIKLYYKRFGAYPPTMDALVKTNEIRFLRKRYKDPMTGKDDWHLIHFGENKTPSYGFFGQPISGAGGSTVAGVGPSGTTAMGPGGLSGANGSSGTTGGPLFGGSQLTGSTPTGGTDSSSGTNGANGTTGTSSGSSDSSGSSSSGTSATGSSGGGSSSSGFGSSSSSGNTNPLTVGGLGIIGVESVSPKPSILVWKKKTHFNEWEFWYDPMADQVMMMNNLGQQGAAATGNSTGQSGFSNQNGLSGNNGSTTTTPTTPTTPQSTTTPQ